MSSSAPKKIFAASVGQATTRAVYLMGETATDATAPTTWPDLSIGLAEVTKQLGKIDPDQSILTGSQAALDSLPRDLKAELIPEDKAIASVEKFLTKESQTPTAILDLGPSAFLDHYPAEEIGRWLPYSANLTDIENYLAGKRLFPRTVPETTKEYEVDLAAARQAIIKLGRGSRDYFEIESRMNLVLTGGLLASIPVQADLISLILDSFYFKSGVTVFLDKNGNLPVLGAILAADLEAPVTSELAQLGTILHLGGAHKISVDFGLSSRQRLDLNGGEIVAWPASPEQAVEITVGGAQASHRYVLSGGSAGVYLDNRGRPLGLAPSSKDSMDKILSWRKMIGSVGEFAEEEVK